MALLDVLHNQVEDALYLVVVMNEVELLNVLKIFKLTPYLLVGLRNSKNKNRIHRQAMSSRSLFVRSSFFVKKTKMSLMFFLQAPL